MGGRGGALEVGLGGVGVIGVVLGVRMGAEGVVGTGVEEELAGRVVIGVAGAVVLAEEEGVAKQPVLVVGVLGAGLAV